MTGVKLHGRAVVRVEHHGGHVGPARRALERGWRRRGSIRNPVSPKDLGFKREELCPLPPGVGGQPGLQARLPEEFVAGPPPLGRHLWQQQAVASVPSRPPGRAGPARAPRGRTAASADRAPTARCGCAAVRRRSPAGTVDPPAPRRRRSARRRRPAVRARPDRCTREGRRPPERDKRAGELVVHVGPRLAPGGGALRTAATSAAAQAPAACVRSSSDHPRHAASGPDRAGIADHRARHRPRRRPNRRTAGHRRRSRPARATPASRPPRARRHRRGPDRARGRSSARRRRTRRRRANTTSSRRRAVGARLEVRQIAAGGDTRPGGRPSHAPARRRARRRRRASARPRESARRRRLAARGPAAADAVRASARPHGRRAARRQATASRRRARRPARAWTGKRPHGVARLPRRSIAHPGNAA